MTSWQNNMNSGIEQLKNNDSILNSIILASKILPELKPHKNYYQELASSIISQQLSVKAAASIEKRFCNFFGSEQVPKPELIIKKSVEELRTLGLSRPKASYIIDLAQHVIDGNLEFGEFDNLSNQQIINELVNVKGIGEWTAHMFLIFCMGRLDVLPYGDLGIKNGIKKLYSLNSMPDKDIIEQIAKNYNWHPYESIASMYIWQSLDNK